jgi:hypothetical protein
MYVIAVCVTVQMIGQFGYYITLKGGMSEDRLQEREAEDIADLKNYGGLCQV